MKWIVGAICIFLLTGCSEKKVVQNENNQKIKMQVAIQTGIEQVQYKNPTIAQNKEASNPITNNQSISVKEEQVYQNINVLEQEVTNLLINDKPETIKEKVITKLITLVDFIYYDVPIGNVYFKELTANVQAKICEILINMDQTIESKLPNYKENINEKYHVVLNYVKTKTTDFTSKTSEKIEEKIGSENYQNFVSGANEMKESVQNTVEWMKEGASKIYGSGKEKVNNWYQELKEKYNK